jgi:hypothetical protein
VRFSFVMRPVLSSSQATDEPNRQPLFSKHTVRLLPCASRTDDRTDRRARGRSPRGTAVCRHGALPRYRPRSSGRLRSPAAFSCCTNPCVSPRSDACRWRSAC